MVRRVQVLSFPHLGPVYISVRRGQTVKIYETPTKTSLARLIRILDKLSPNYVNLETEGLGVIYDCPKEAHNVS